MAFNYNDNINDNDNVNENVSLKKAKQILKGIGLLMQPLMNLLSALINLKRNTQTTVTPKYCFRTLLIALLCQTKRAVFF